ncbi:MAG: mandelate racemase/muconate lactonizing enzyme family protein [Alphaproteobacteria bacterium]
MRIARIAVWEFHRVFDPPLWNPATVWRERRAPLVTVEADGGPTGVGEAWCRQDEIARSFAALQAAAAPLIGCPVDDVFLPLPSAAMDWPEAGAVSAIDMAIWDLRAQAAGVPLARLLAAEADGAEVYASGGLYGPGKDVHALAAEMAGYVAEGFATVKMKVGALPAEGDLARVDAVLRATDGAAVIVDGVGSYDADGAAAMAAMLAERGVRAFQTPLRDSAPSALAALARRCPLPLVLGEAEWDHARLRHLSESGAAGWLQANASLAGGPSGMSRLSAMARDCGIPFSPQCHATAVLQAATLHIAAADGTGPAEHHRVHDHLQDLLAPALRRPSGGRVAIPPLPGLGLSLPAHRVRPVLALAG